MSINLGYSTYNNAVQNILFTEHGACVMVWMLSLLHMSCVDYEINRRTMVDSYVQSSREAGVDIVWVIDNSASMFEEQEQLAEYVSHFTDYLTFAPVEFTLSVVTTDVSTDDAGAFVHGVVLNNNTAHLDQAFADLVSLDEGSRSEHGFAAALDALDPNGINADIWTANADIEIIFFSDEDDQSDVSSADFVNTMQSYRPDVELTFNAITGDPPEGCASLVGAADPGFKYQEVQEETGGLRESICSLHYDALLERIALQVLGLSNTFALNSAPDLDTLEVLVNGASIPRRERHGWRYDAGENTIIFDGFAVPPPGADIVFKYALWIGTQSDLEASVSDTGE